MLSGISVVFTIVRKSSGGQAGERAEREEEGRGERGRGGGERKGRMRKDG